MISVNTSFLTDLKTLMSSFVHSVIVHVCARYEFSGLSDERLVSGPLNSFPLVCFWTIPCCPLPGGRGGPVGHFWML